MRVIDASSIVYGWDNYPILQFPPLWRWIADQIQSNAIAMSRVAFDEVTNVAPECSDWLKNNDVLRIDVTNEIVQNALDIKNHLGIQNDDYHPNGVDENDILIIATAQVEGGKLISNENKQTSLPNNKKKYKIPAVCNISDVSVLCINFVEYIKQSDQVFE